MSKMTSNAVVLCSERSPERQVAPLLLRNGVATPRVLGQLAVGGGDGGVRRQQREEQGEGDEEQSHGYAAGGLAAELNS